MPVYRVDREGKKPRVVDAKTPGAARAHVAASELTVAKIDTAEAFKLAMDGAELEKAGDAPAEPESQQDDDD